MRPIESCLVLGAASVGRSHEQDARTNPGRPRDPGIAVEPGSCGRSGDDGRDGEHVRLIVRGDVSRVSVTFGLLTNAGCGLTVCCGPKADCLFDSSVSRSR
jgi:hypothetical protein